MNLRAERTAISLLPKCSLEWREGGGEGKQGAVGAVSVETERPPLPPVTTCPGCPATPPPQGYHAAGSGWMTIRSEGRRPIAGRPRPRGDLGCESSPCSPAGRRSCRGGSHAVLVMGWCARPLTQLSLLRWFQHRPRCQGVVCVLREPTEAARPRQASADEPSRYRQP